MTKILALYLPQYHATKENDEWWGEGFTEWNIVKDAKAINKHTKQPRIPVNGYYDLSQKDSIVKQVELANLYGVDGFVLYNYYSNGEKLLDTPSELIFMNKDIDIEYCFSWANHDWMRTWFSYDKEMLRKQNYASNDDEIIEHYNYLKKFFNDERYIKIENKPIFIIYNYYDIPNFDKYIEIWNNLAIEDGFLGIYFIQTLGGKNLTWNKEYFNACFDFEPTFTTFSDLKTVHFNHRIKRYFKKISKSNKMTNIFDYNLVCKKMENRIYEEKEHCYGMFAEWDNTPRHKHNGTIFSNFTLDRYKKCFAIQYNKSKENDHPFLIFDAWNEWGEGAILEPDNIFGLKKLEIIRDIKQNDEIK